MIMCHITLKQTYQNTHLIAHSVNKHLFFSNTASQDLDRGQGDFPLSTALLERKMKIGLTALNVASLSLPRMTQTYGKVWYVRVCTYKLDMNKLQLT